MTSSSHRQRIGLLWICVGLFFLRVIGQIEVWLIAPAWLPPMAAWYSGLLPYPLLLPIQIVILMVMPLLVVRESRRGAGLPDTRYRRWVRGFAIVYFDVMLIRVAIQLLRGEDVFGAGAIPVAFHWVLALFLLLWARKQTATNSLYRDEAAG